MVDEPYTMDGGIARLRVVESRGLGDATRRVKTAIRHAAASNVDKLLVDIRDITIDPPTLSERHWVMTEWSSVGRGLVRVAVVVPVAFVDPDNYGSVVAASRGLQLRGFVEFDDAVAWLGENQKPGR